MKRITYRRTISGAYVTAPADGYRAEIVRQHRNGYTGWFYSSTVWGLPQSSGWFATLREAKAAVDTDFRMIEVVFA